MSEDNISDTTSPHDGFVPTQSKMLKESSDGPRDAIDDRKPVFREDRNAQRSVIRPLSRQHT